MYSEIVTMIVTLVNCTVCQIGTQTSLIYLWKGVSIYMYMFQINNECKMKEYMINLHYNFEKSTYYQPLPQVVFFPTS